MSTNPIRQQAAYERKRSRREPPMASLRDIRLALGLTLDEVASRIATETGEPAPLRGTLSSIESGTRGASAEMLDALSVALGMPAGALTTDYAPRALRVAEAAA